jgi:hypothetical protein
MRHYPANWPRCPVCNKFAKTGYITCGNPGCDESKLRQERVLEYWRIKKPKGESHDDKERRRGDDKERKRGDQ